jgi:adenylate cyclase class IV
MARNIEIKALIGSAHDLQGRVACVATSGPTVLRHDDTFFTCTYGRLKLRAFPDGTGELIFYKRENTPGPKISSYHIAPVHCIDALRDTLSKACGETGRVVKSRLLYMTGRTRIHIDQVDGLGDFLELEVVLREDESAEAGIAEARLLMAALGIREDTLVDRSYVDLLNAITGGSQDSH